MQKVLHLTEKQNCH